jgi:hypothetical protein
MTSRLSDACYFCKEVNAMNKYLVSVGSLSIRKEYLNVTGGPSASGIDEFTNWLGMWEYGFGRNGKLVKLHTLLE